MFCKKCGAEIAGSVKFCPKCGTPVTSQAAPERMAEAPESAAEAPERMAEAPESAAKNPEAPARKKKKGWLWILAALVVLAAAAAIFILVSQPKKVNLEEYVKVEFSGYNTVGTASAFLDPDTLLPYVAEILDEDQDDLLEDGDWDYLCEEVELSLDRADGLKNGDTVTVSISYDNEAIEDFKLRFTGETVTATVDGLEDLAEIDPFEELMVTFTGIAPEGQVELAYIGDSRYLDTYSFTCDQWNDLKNGDVILVSVPDYNEEEAMAQGYRLTQTSKEYTVEGLDAYVASYEQLTEDFRTAVRAESEDAIQAYAAQAYNADCAMTGLEYAGYVFLAPKEGGNAREYNELYVIYRGSVSHNANQFPVTWVYYPVRFLNILSAGGALSYEDGPAMAGVSTLPGGYYTNGYSNPLTAYEALVTANADDYTSQAGDGFEAFASYTPIASLADIGEANRQALEARAQDVILAYTASSYSGEAHVSELTLVGEYLLVSKAQGTEDFQNNNHLIVVYSATVSHETNVFEPATVYFPVQFDGLANLPNGEFLYTAESQVLGNSVFPNSIYYTNGYLDGAQMFNDLVTANRTDYTYEVSEGLKAFGE